MKPWNEAKNKINRRRHGISFESALFVFEDPFALTVEDYIDDSGKMRFQTIGMISDHMLINVAHVYRVIEDHETPWIISARKAVKYEKDTYQNHRRNEA